MIDPDGRKEDLGPNPGGFRATEVKFKEEGGWIIASTIKPGFYTMYMEKGKMRHKIGPKTGLKGVILSLYYEQYAKALINVGEAKDDSFARPVGHKLEIVPLKNPYKLRGCGGRFFTRLAYCLKENQRSTAKSMRLTVAFPLEKILLMLPLQTEKVLQK